MQRIQKKNASPEGLRQLSGEKEILGININEMGREAAAIKVIARMFGLRFDTLWQRHERAKRRRRLSVIAGVILFSLISFSVGAYMVEKPGRRDPRFFHPPTPSPQSASDPPLKCPGLSLQACILFFCLSVLLSSPPRLFV